MNTARGLGLAIWLGTAACFPLQASADTFSFSFSGPDGISGNIALTYGSLTDARYSQAFKVTDITGTFSDSFLGIQDAAIQGLVATTHSRPDATNLLAPDEFSRFAVAKGTPSISNGFASYDNLFWPGGSPQTASDYPGRGGFLDIYGLMFRIGEGRVVNFWSNGSIPLGNGEFVPLSYGASVATVDLMSHYVEGGIAAVPEPTTVALFLGGLLGLGLLHRRRSAHPAA